MPPLNVSERDRRALIALGIAVVVFGAVYFWPEQAPGRRRALPSVPQAEKRLERLTRQAAAVPGRLEILKKAKDELARREKGIVTAETPAQAQARLLEIVRRVGRAQQPPLGVRGGEFRDVRALNDAYAEVGVTVQIEAGIEQILNLMADLGNQPELLSLNDVSFSQANGKQKTVPARMTVTAIVPRSLAPARKEASF
ncbi:MAG: hypothetical protein MUC42_17060 [Bryobacter sp.]|jgi:hypothetical protein|nr:hypothetical protein [Bryobacter sp.]